MPGPYKDPLGPGTLTIGPVGTPLDFSCQVISARVDWSEDVGDDTPVLCGDIVPGAATYTAEFTGTVLQDLSAPAAEGIVEFSWANKGTEQEFTFVPSTSAGKQVTGTLVVTPLSVGHDAVNENMTSDFTWRIVGEPELTAAA